jgi:hypothetical protein
MQTRLRVVPALCAALIAVACGSGGGGGGGGGTPAVRDFVVRTVDPRAGSSNVPNDRSVIVGLGDAVEKASVTETSFFVTLAGEETPLSGIRSVSTDGLRITFDADPWYATSSPHVVHVTTALRSRDGRNLPSDFTSQFRTGPWSSPEPIVQSFFREVGERMDFGRSRHTSTSIMVGSEVVLLAGGYTSGLSVTNSAEVFSVEAETFFPTVGRMADARASHTAVLLDSGFVLLSGGEKLSAGGIPVALSSSELFAVASTTFVRAPSMAVARTAHTATLLPDGRVLVIGGDAYDADGWPTATASAELYDPDPFPGQWTATAGDMEIPRSGHQATLLADGRVLLTGGSTSRVVEVFDPATNSFSRVQGKLAEARWRHGAVRLPTGRVLVEGGGSQKGELYDPATEEFSDVPGGDSQSRYAAVTFEFLPGRVLILGGFEFLPDGNILLHSTMNQFLENYGPYGAFFEVMTLPPNGVYIGSPRAYSAASPLADGRFLITGGLGPTYEGPDLDSALLFDPTD